MTIKHHIHVHDCVPEVLTKDKSVWLHIEQGDYSINIFMPQLNQVEALREFADEVRGMAIIKEQEETSRAQRSFEDLVR